MRPQETFGLFPLSSARQPRRFDRCNLIRTQIGVNTFFPVDTRKGYGLGCEGLEGKGLDMRLAAHVAPWTERIAQWLADNAPTYTRHTVTTGREAWTIARMAGVTNEAYALSRDITDGHIQTALERVFPNAVFRDAKRY